MEGQSFITTVSIPTQALDGNAVSSNFDPRYLESFPPGYRFQPFDEELIEYYLKKKVNNEDLPPNKIFEVNLYQFNPKELADMYLSRGQKEMYFFTPRERKYRNGNRPNRAAGDGYWKATGADKAVKFNGQKEGAKKSLVFYAGKPPKGVKTNWIMHEFTLLNPPQRQERGAHGMRLDDWVLCRIYENTRSGLKGRKSQDQDNEVEAQETDGSIAQTPHSVVTQQMPISYSTMLLGENFAPLIENEHIEVDSFYHYHGDSATLLSSYDNVGFHSQTLENIFPEFFPHPFSRVVPGQLIGTPSQAMGRDIHYQYAYNNRTTTQQDSVWAVQNGDVGGDLLTPKQSDSSRP